MQSGAPLKVRVRVSSGVVSCVIRVTVRVEGGGYYFLSLIHISEPTRPY